MNSFTKLLLLFSIFNFQNVLSQENQNANVLKIVLKKYYKSEKIVYKGRSQLLYFYCDKANNNEELIEATKNKELPKEFLNEIKSKIATDVKIEDWSVELNEIYATDLNNLKQKINDCKTLEKYHIVSKKLNLNNQRLLIVSKPLFYSKGTIALVKITFYRNIEHNNGVILLLEKVNNEWVIKDELNSWST